MSSNKAKSSIPIKNLYLLLYYASKLYNETLGTGKYAVEDVPDDVPDLVARILTSAVERRLRRNLSLDIECRQADLSRVRGRIDHLRTERHYLLQQGKVACLFDEFTADTPKNRFVKAALNEIARHVEDEELNRRCRAAAVAFERYGVGGASSHWNKTPFVTGRVNVEDRQMLAAAELAFDLRLPTEDPGSLHLSTLDRDKLLEGGRLFEAAVGSFYKVVLRSRGWDVQTGSRIEWQAKHSTTGIKNILPQMKTDIVLEYPGPCPQSRIVIDTKFTEILTVPKHGKPVLKSAHIYQIYAYLRSQEKQEDPLSYTASGLLLYPSVGNAVDEHTTIQGHKIHFATVDLAADSPSIRKRLQDVIVNHSWN